MKRTQAVRLIALIAALVCLLAWLPAQAGASTSQRVGQQAAAAVSAPDVSVATTTTTSPFSLKDLMVLAMGATALLAFGVGFRRISAPLE